MKKLILLSIQLFLYSCATTKLQVVDTSKSYSKPESDIAHSFYILGNTLAQENVWNAVLNDRENTDDLSTLLFLGNSADNYLDTEKINYKNTLKFLADFKGNIVFVPGSQEWNTGLGDLKSLQKKIKKQLDDAGFSLKNGCPIDKITIGEDIQLIIVDSQWFLNDWDDFPTINDDCEIKSRSDFFDEFGSLIKKARGKTTIVALHHPMFSNGEYGGQYSFESHMKPLPLIGSFKNILRRTTGAHAADLNSKRYIEFRDRLITLAQENKKVIFASAHEKNLQFISEDNIPQIISGAGSELTETKLKNNGLFAYAANGYAKLNVYKNGASQLTFYTITENNTSEIVYGTEIYAKNKAETIPNYATEFPSKVSAAIYTTEETDVSGFHTFLWGDRYRKYYSTKVEAPTVNLDTLFGGLVPVRKGGGNQSKSLRLQDKNGAQYVMRALRKNAVQYLQATMFKDKYIDGKFDNTGVESLILDVFTGSHPYAPFVIGDLADAVDVFHTNPVLYYVPKQNALGSFNADFGDELYMIEEHTSEGHSDTKSFGFQDKIISTIDMMNRIHKDEDISVDESGYIRARLFDMLIGDWDRHQDQWRWIEFKENGKKVYRPLPRDRDQAFSIMSDGFVLGAAVELLPTARLLRKYSDDLKDVKGINVEPYPLDMEIIQQSNKAIWDQQVQRIQSNVTDEVIEKAFLHIPVEVRDETISAIKQKLKARRKNLQKIADRYYELLTKYIVIKGTNKDDWFEIERLPNKQTKVTAYRIKNGEKGTIFHERVYNREETKEIWIYALDD
ncbi:MAG: phosphoesterase, partial [Bacteroidota bacterium]